MSVSSYHKLLLRLNPEFAHYLALNTLDLSRRLKIGPAATAEILSLPCRVMGLNFPNPVGLAAGFDKNGDYIDALGNLGFGFIEVGTVTPRPQPGNPKPRLFRIPQAEAVINRMGFNNKGVDYLVSKVKRSNYKGVLGINIGKNFNTPMEKAVDDYLAAMRKIYTYAEYIVVNISSPNTPNLRILQTAERLNQLVGDLKAEQVRLANKYNRYVPLVIKIAPDLTTGEIKDMADILRHQGVDGVIATNTTISREGVAGMPHSEEQGGLSGAPLTKRATEVVKTLHAELKGSLPIIASGGVMTADDAVDKFRAGAGLVQVYSGLVYRGPVIVKEIMQAAGKLKLISEEC